MLEEIEGDDVMVILMEYDGEIECKDNTIMIYTKQRYHWIMRDSLEMLGLLRVSLELARDSDIVRSVQVFG